MKKFFRLVFSGYGLVVFILILELAIIIAAQVIYLNLEYTGIIDPVDHPYIFLGYIFLRVTM